MGGSGKEVDYDIEMCLLRNFVDNNANVSDSNMPDSVRNILLGRYWLTLNNELQSLFPVDTLCDTDVNFGEAISAAVEREVDTYHAWLCSGVASLLYFVQCNWTGPQKDLNDSDDWLASKRVEALQELSLNDECNENVKRPELLYFAKVIFSNVRIQAAYKSCIWWLFRSSLLHHFIIEEASASLYEETKKLIADVNSLHVLKEPYFNTLFHLEVAQFYFYYRRIQLSEKHLECAQDTAKLACDLQGAMGKRTKYQQDEKPQLYLKITIDKGLFPSRDCSELPKSVDLNDDLRLERVEFSENTDKTKLGSLEEAVVLSKFTQLQLSQPKHELTTEEVKPYLSYLIDNTKNWTLKMTCLYHRCCLESEDKRSIERAMAQSEYLIQDSSNINAPVSEKLDVFFASGMKAIWKLEELWANIMRNLGLAKGALDVFIKLKLWEDVIVCYEILNLKHKAAEIIRQELAKKPTVKLCCLLGDATQDVTHYETAWKLSNEKSSRAQRHWGFFYFARKEYDKAIPHLKLSAELNNIQETVWIRLGFAALQTEDWKLAAMAYRRYCALEQTTFEAWNNLAKAYIKLGDKPRAWKSLQDAIKCNYDRWEVWDNLMVVSIDLGHFSEVLRCYHRILDLRGQHLDIQVLEILTKAVREDINDSDGQSARKLLQKTLELFGRISSSSSANPDVWKMYAELASLKRTDIDDQKAARYLQQAHRAAVSNPRWFQTADTTLSVLGLCCKLTDTYLRCASNCTDVTKRISLLGSAKLTLQGVVKKVKDQQWTDSNVIVHLEKVEDCLKTVLDEIEKIKASN